MHLITLNVALCNIHVLIHQVEALSVQDIKSSFLKFLKKTKPKKVIGF